MTTTAYRGHIALAGGRVALRTNRRAVLVCLLLAALLAGTVLGALVLGGGYLTPNAVLGAIIGFGDVDTNYVVLVLRLPRVLVAVGAGAALAISGAVFQSLTRNPLGSPDVIGFTSGASAAAVLALVVFGAGQFGVAVAAVLGALLTALLVYLLAYRNGVSGYRLVLVGIGAGAILLSLVDYLLTRTGLGEAQSAQVWLVGSLNLRSWEQVVPVFSALLILLPVALAFVRRLNLLEMGDDTARALGLRVESTRLGMVLLGVVLCAVGTASAGPIAFVALTSPQLARRLTRSTGAGLVAAGLMGALLLLLSDLVAQSLPGNEPPVGVLTGVLGGLYLAWLLSREWRANRS